MDGEEGWGGALPPPSAGSPDTIKGAHPSEGLGGAENPGARGGSSGALVYKPAFTCWQTAAPGRIHPQAPASGRAPAPSGTAVGKPAAACEASRTHKWGELIWARTAAGSKLGGALGGARVLQAPALNRLPRRCRTHRSSIAETRADTSIPSLPRDLLRFNAVAAAS